jgi:alpha-beta hydrolase superfamily lysophospholipase
VRAGLDNVTLISYDDARHEVFNETNSDEVSADTLEWLKLQLG